MGTGDLVLFGLADPSNRYFAFGMSELWTHTGVVVRHHYKRPGIPNHETEQLLLKAPFRRRAHCFCTPAYCTCYDEGAEAEEVCGLIPATAEHRFSTSNIPNTGHLEILEAAGVGVHAFDL